MVINIDIAVDPFQDNVSMNISNILTDYYSISNQI